ncbi:MAG: Kazal-type serine protease inhibitor domain-containing protein [Candidatus Binatia bacterium]
MTKQIITWTLTALVLAASARPTAAARVCPGGRFVVEDVGGLARDGAGTTLTLGDGAAALEGLCPGAPVGVAVGHGGTTVRAAWDGCQGVAGRLRLKARIDGTCSTVVGVLRARRPPFRHRFVGHRNPACAEDPACHPAARCATSDDCGAGEFCAHRPGHCDGPGACVARPDVCTEESAPVCGCDGTTYENRCRAAAAGVSAAHAGRCGCADVMCSPGTRPVDTDGDGCPDACTAPCHDACDCYRNSEIGFPEPCPLDCATCDDYWRCEEGSCTAHCGPVPPEVRECVAPPVCHGNDDCPETSWCVGRPGSCDGPGVCQPRPEACTREHDPVCGCDGKTYPNACAAAAAGVRIASDRACECPAILCLPGTRPVDTDGDGCADGCRAPCDDVCDCERDPAIRSEDRCPMLCPTCGQYFTCDEGACVEHCGPIPPENLACHLPPTCGDDTDCARTPGACDAAAHGASVAARGPCPKRCGGIAGLPCGEHEVCELPPGMCGAADLQGRCVPVGDACPDLWHPVCGCDGATYGNDCERRRAGVQLDHAGACEPAAATE